MKNAIDGKEASGRLLKRSRSKMTTKPHQGAPRGTERTDDRREREEGQGEGGGEGPLGFQVRKPGQKRKR